MGILKKIKRKKRREMEAKERLFYPTMEEPKDNTIDVVENINQEKIESTIDIQSQPTESDIIENETITVEKDTTSQNSEESVDVDESTDISVEETQNAEEPVEQIVEEANNENQKIQINEQNNEINIEDNVQVSDAIDVEKKS